MEKAACQWFSIDRDLNFERGRVMEVMMYVLWMLLLVGSVLKNHLLFISVPKAGQALPAEGKKADPKRRTENRNEKIIDFAKAVKRTIHNQTFGWIDTS
jgi:hypothetical protein